MENATNNSLVTSTPAPTNATADTTAEWLRVIKIVFLCAISFVGFVANVTICRKLMRRKRKSSEYFIINLAVIDLTVCAVGIPLDIYQVLHDTWQFGAFLCKLIWPCQTLLMLVSIMTLTAMSLERHRAIMTPFKPRLKKSDLLKAIACVWIIGLCVIAAYVRFLEYNGKQCEESWSVETGAYYTLTLFIIDYCIPLTIITYCYARAGFKLYENTKQFKRVNATLSNFAQRKRLQRNTRIIKLFSFAVLMFFVCMLPGDCYWMWKSFGNGSTFKYENHFEVFSNILVYANSAMNPFIFGACHFGCFSMLRSSPDHRRLKRHHRIISFQSQESNSQLPQVAVKKARHKKDATDVNLNLVDMDKLRETDV